MTFKSAAIFLIIFIAPLFLQPAFPQTPPPSAKAGVVEKELKKASRLTEKKKQESLIEIDDSLLGETSVEEETGRSPGKDEPKR